MKFKEFGDAVPFSEVTQDTKLYVFSERDCKIYTFTVSSITDYNIHFVCRVRDVLNSHYFGRINYHRGWLLLMHSYNNDDGESCLFSTSKKEIIDEARKYKKKVCKLINSTIKNDI